MASVEWSVGLLFLIAFLLPSSSSSCTSCVNSLIELETCLLADNGNMESLIQAFYPTNVYPALWVKLNYYFKYINETRNSSVISNEEVPDHVFFWASSPILIFISPRIIRGASLTFVDIDESHVANLVIPSFCWRNDFYDTNEELSLDLINNVTIWLKSYAVHRGIPEGLDTSLQGYVVYEIPTNKELRVLSNSGIYIRYEIQLAVSFLLICLGVFVYGPFKLWSLQKKFREMSECQLIQPNQQFRFKSILWSFVLTLFLLELLVASYDLYIIPWQYVKKWLFYILIGGAMGIGFVDFVIAVCFVMGNITVEKMIEVPRLCLFAFDPNKNIDRENPKSIKCTRCRKTTIIVLHVIAYFSFLVMLLFLSIHGCGIVLALLAHPAQAFFKVLVALTVFMAVVMLFTYTFERFESPFQEENDTNEQPKDDDKSTDEQPNENIQRPRKHCRPWIKSHYKKWKGSICKNVSCAVFRLLFNVLVCVFLYLFLDTYTSAILYVGNDGAEFSNFIVQIFPAVLLSLFGWMIKREYKNFKKNNLTLDSTSSRKSFKRDRSFKSYQASVIDEELSV